MNKEALTPLVIKAQAKDADALNELMSACYETLYYYAYNEVKDYDLAADITQESCLEIMDTLENLRKPESFLSWAGRIVTHKCSRYYRQTKKEVFLEENEDGETILDRLPDDSRGSLPEQVQEDKEFKRIMWEMLDSLPPEQRQALLLYYMEDFSVGQIAEMQDVPAGTVKSRLNYGRKAVMSKVDAYEKKNGIKLHSLAPLPLLLSFLFRENKAAVSKSATGALQKVYAGITASGAASVGSTATAAAVGTGLATKIIAGVTAAIIVLTSSVIFLPKLLSGKVLEEKPGTGLEENADNEPDQVISFAQFEGEWTCLTYDVKTNGPITEETFVVYEIGILEFRGQRYRLRPDHSSEPNFIASPEDIPIPQSNWLTADDKFWISFDLFDGDALATLSVISTAEGSPRREVFWECFRLSNYEGYTPVLLTEDNITKYLHLEIIWDAMQDEDGNWTVFDKVNIYYPDECALISYCRFTPTIEYTLERATMDITEEGWLSLSLDSALPETETKLVSLDNPILYGLPCFDSLTVLNQPGTLEPGQTPNGLEAMFATDARLVGATDVYGFVFVPNK